MIDEILDFLGDGWEYIISFEWLSDIGEIFSSGLEAFSNIEDSPLVNVWFWAFYICLLAGVWVLPKQFGVMDYTLGEKFMYTVIFFVIDWFIVQHFRSS